MSLTVYTHCGCERCQEFRLREELEEEHRAKEEYGYEATDEVNEASDEAAAHEVC